MKILLNKDDLNEALHKVPKLGFIPTMGSIHKGHISLIERSKKECDKTIVSIFVNPNQFNNKKDFKRYPRNSKKDLSILKKLKVNFVYLPTKKDVYKSKRKSKIILNKKDQILCAQYRKGHFEGVIDVMDRLTNLIKPKKIYMGQKDLQQLNLVKSYIENKYKSEIVSCKTIRDLNGLALSSRNLLLNNKEITKARYIAKKLITIKSYIKNQNNIKKFLTDKKIEMNKMFNVKIEYLELRNIKSLKVSNQIKDSRLLIAYYVNRIRLIDNI